MQKTPSLLTRTRTLLKRDKRNLREISEAAGVTYFWLRRFKRNDFRNPGILHVEALHNELSK